MPVANNIFFKYLSAVRAEVVIDLYFSTTVRTYCRVAIPVRHLILQLAESWY
jgi:hypothetical protein